MSESEKEIRRVLFATDFSRCSEQALPHAVFLARELGAELRLFHALIPHYERFDVVEASPVDPETLLRKLEEKADGELARLAAGLGEIPVPVTRGVRRGPYAGPLILTEAEEAHADLVVLGTHGRRGLGRWVLGSVAEEVVRLADCPVLTVKEQAEPCPPKPLERILVPIDFSPCSRRALVWARRLAARFEGQLTLLHVVEQVVLPSFYIPGAPGLFPRETEPLHEITHRELSRWMREEAGEGPDVAFETRVINASPADGIARFAREHQTDLIVLATHGLRGVERLVLGSTTQRVVQRAPCPVLTLAGAAAAA